MIISSRNIARFLATALTGLVLSVSVKAFALESEISQVTLFVEGMMKSRGGVTWMSWPDSVVAALSELPGIEEDEIKVNLERDAFTLSYDPARVSLEDMYFQITELGYTPGLDFSGSLEAPNQREGESSPIKVALSKAKDEGKLIVVVFSAEWCLACRVFKEQVLSDSAVQKAFSDYVFLDVDTDEYPKAAITYNVVGMPTMVILSAVGEELFRSIGLIEATSLIQKLEELVSR